MNCLGTNFDIYFDSIRDWCFNKISKKELDRILKLRLTRMQLRMHNKFISEAFGDGHVKFVFPDIYANPPRSRRYKSPKNVRITAKMLHFRSSARKTNEPLFPVDTSVYRRFTFCTSHYGVNGTDENVCKLIESACMMFAKNIISAVIARKSGFKVYRSKLMHNYGMPGPNPWLINTANYNCRANYSTKVYKTEDGSYVKIPDYKKVERDILFQLSAAKSHMTRKSPIIVEDVIDALKVHKHVIPQTFIYSLFMQKLLLSKHCF